MQLFLNTHIDDIELAKFEMLIGENSSLNTNVINYTRHLFESFNKGAARYGLRVADPE